MIYKNGERHTINGTIVCFIARAKFNSSHKHQPFIFQLMAYSHASSKYLRLMFIRWNKISFCIETNNYLLYSFQSTRYLNIYAVIKSIHYSRTNISRKVRVINEHIRFLMDNKTLLHGRIKTNWSFNTSDSLQQ